MKRFLLVWANSFQPVARLRWERSIWLCAISMDRAFSRMALSPAMIEGMLMAARREHPAIATHLRNRGVLLQNTVRKDPAHTPIQQDFIANGTHHTWRCNLQADQENVQAHALMYWTYLKPGVRNYEDLHAIQLRDGLKPLHFDAHFYSRHGVRHSGTRDLLFNMIKFFKFHPRLDVYELGTLFEGNKAVVAAVPDGLLHGHLLGAEIINMDTYISEDMLEGIERWVPALRTPTFRDDTSGGRLSFRRPGDRRSLVPAIRDLTSACSQLLVCPVAAVP